MEPRPYRAPPPPDRRYRRDGDHSGVQRSRQRRRHDPEPARPDHAASCDRRRGRLLDRRDGRRGPRARGRSRPTADEHRLQGRGTNFGLRYVRTPLTVAIDADTVLAPDALECLLPAFSRPAVAAACGFVLPQRVRSLWERGRYIEYLFAFTYYKQLQEYYGKPLISSGCFSMYRTEILGAHNGWSNRTLAEDGDLTWSLYQSGHEVRFVPEAVCYPIEPRTLTLMGTQLRRWSHGFVQNVKLHWRGLLAVPYLRSAVAVAFWDATIAAAVYLVLLPILALLLARPWVLIGYVIDAPAVLVPVLAGAARRREIRRAIASIPAFFVLRTVNAVFFLRAVCAELLLGRSLRVYEKGH